MSKRQTKPAALEVVVAAGETNEPAADIAVPPLAAEVLREAIRAEHEGRHADAAALRVTDRCLGEVIMSLPIAVEHSDGELRERLNGLLTLLTR